MKLGLSTILAALVCVAVATGMLAQQALADPYEALAKYQFGQSREPLATIEAQIRKTPASGYKDIEGRLLAVLKSPKTTKDAKRYICRWLTMVGSAECIPAVAALLTDEDLSHPARMALEPKADPAAGAALRAALPKVKGRLLAGVIGSIGVRRDAEAVEALTRLARDADPMIAGAAISALGEIGTEEAVRALEGTWPPKPLSRIKAQAKITAAGRLAAAGKRAEAAKLYGTLISHVHPQAVRIAAVKGIIGTVNRDVAVQTVFDFLHRPNEGDEKWMRAVAIAAYLGSTDKAMKDAVAERLPTMNRFGQLGLLRALVDAPDVAARPAVLKVLQSASDVEVRVAALECLARHGEAADVPMIVRLANAKPETVADAARKVLQRMGKPGVDEALARLIESPEAADRAVVLSVLGDRRVESALPILVRLVAGSDTASAAEAAKALGVLGKSEQLTALAAVLIHPQSAEVRSAAVDAVKAICARAPDKQGAAKALLAAMEKAPTPAARGSVLQLLVYTRGQEALKAVRKTTGDPNADLRETAIRTLVAWPEGAAAPYLIELARTSEKPAHAVLALRDGCLRLANLNEVPLAERLAIYRSVLDVAKRAEEKKQAIAGLAQLPSLGALALLQGCTKDASLASDATSAAIRLARQLGPIYPKQAKAALEQIKSQAATEEVKKAVDEAIRALRSVGLSPEGFIVAWMLSGPYVQEGKGGSELFMAPFAPEKAGGKAEWRPVVVPPGGRPGLVEMDKILGGDNRVCYLRTQILSPKEQDALLEIGSDDGVKVWLNGRVVHANNAIRPCRPDQDKVKVRLKQGDNAFLMKVTQGGGEWSVCCRLRSPDGKALEGVAAAPEEP